MAPVSRNETRVRVMLMGSSGVGKSTIVNLVYGLEEEDEGYCPAGLRQESITTRIKPVPGLPTTAGGGSVRVELVDTMGCPRDTERRDAEFSNALKLTAEGRDDEVVDPATGRAYLPRGQPAALLALVLKMDRATNAADYAVLSEMVRNMPKKHVVLLLVNPSRPPPGSRAEQKVLQQERDYVRATIMKDRPFMKCHVVGSQYDPATADSLRHFLAECVRGLEQDGGLCTVPPGSMRSYQDIDNELAERLHWAQLGVLSIDAAIASQRRALQEAEAQLAKAMEDKEKMSGLSVKKVLTAAAAFVGVAGAVALSIITGGIGAAATAPIAAAAFELGRRAMNNLFDEQLAEAVEEAQARRNRIQDEVAKAQTEGAMALVSARAIVQEAERAQQAWEEAKQCTTAAIPV